MTTIDDQAFGRHAPRGWIGQSVALTRRCPSTWTGRRLAFAIRAVAIRLLRGRPIDVVSLGVRMRLYPAHNVSEKNLLFTPQWFDPAERGALAEVLAGDFTFVDVGANAGGYALFAASLAGPRARIVAIEPLSEIFERLIFNIQQNHFSSIKAYACAVADHDGEITMFVDENNKGESSMRLVPARSTGHHVRVPAKTLRTILAEERVERLDALKIDVEGAEDLILEPFFRDAERSVWPRLLVLAAPPGREPVELIAAIRERGYEQTLATRTNVVLKRR